MQQVKAGLKAIYLSAGRSRPTPTTTARCTPTSRLYSVDSVPKVVKRINAAFTRADQIQWSEGKDDDRLLRAHRRRCRSRLRRRAERVRADEGDDRRRRRRRALRGPAGQRQEVRPHGRQGAGADARSGRQARRRAPGRRRDGHADDPAGAHRRRSRRPRHQRRRRQRQALPAPASAPSKASSARRTASTRRSAAAWPTRRTPT